MLRRRVDSVPVASTRRQVCVLAVCTTLAKVGCDCDESDIAFSPSLSLDSVDVDASTEDSSLGALQAEVDLVEQVLSSVTSSPSPSAPSSGTNPNAEYDDSSVSSGCDQPNAAVAAVEATPGGNECVTVLTRTTSGCDQDVPVAGIESYV